MAPGSVIVDLAAERGGNCELTRPGETVVHRGVTILGPLNLPSEVPHARQPDVRRRTSPRSCCTYWPRTASSRSTWTTRSSARRSSRATAASSIPASARPWASSPSRGTAPAKEPADLETEEEGKEAPDVYGIQSDADRTGRELTTDSRDPLTHQRISRTMSSDSVMSVGRHRRAGGRRAGRQDLS